MKITEQMIPHIERAMGFELYGYQKRYLLNSGQLLGGRRTGKTTAKCIELALSDGEPLDIKRPHLFSDRNDRWYAHTHFIGEFMRIRARLKLYGFPVRDIKPNPVYGKKASMIVFDEFHTADAKEES